MSNAKYLEHTSFAGRAQYGLLLSGCRSLLQRARRAVVGEVMPLPGGCSGRRLNNTAAPGAAEGPGVSSRLSRRGVTERPHIRPGCLKLHVMKGLECQAKELEPPLEAMGSLRKSWGGAGRGKSMKAENQDPKTCALQGLRREGHDLELEALLQQ